MPKLLLTTTLVCVFMFGAIPNISLANTYQNNQSTAEPQTTEVIFDNDNWFTLPHPEPLSFTFSENGEVYGTTTTGIPFSQINVPNDYGVRVQKFIIQNHYHFVLADRVVYTEVDLDAAILEIVNKNSTLAGM